VEKNPVNLQMLVGTARFASGAAPFGGPGLPRRSFSEGWRMPVSDKRSTDHGATPQYIGLKIKQNDGFFHARVFKEEL
jgi:hypothetical protein